MTAVAFRRTDILIVTSVFSGSFCTQMVTTDTLSFEAGTLGAGIQLFFLVGSASRPFPPPLLPPAPCPGSDRKEISRGSRHGAAEEREPLPGERLGSLAPTAILMVLLLGMWGTQALEMFVGKIPFLVAEPLWPLHNRNGTMDKLCDLTIPIDGANPNVRIFNDRVEFVGKDNNISILLWNITFDDEGEYICYGRNQKEKGKNHSATFTLYVVDELKEVDNTLTIIIASAVGGVIGLFVAFMLLKNLTLFVLAKIEEKNKECLVSSSGMDNTENGLSGSKGSATKATPKKA
ncbi:hypothetical protein AGOR_G00031610 [Albula goreensis]|uniref:Uncharacterized protein n=1 Tax=Albula goreensis TaxID=1534307 RepID=A0A8T3E790_9TELE|nr:hypothetical protein AGOR_G00031610 [Albula goreensis]